MLFVVSASLRCLFLFAFVVVVVFCCFVVGVTCVVVFVCFDVPAVFKHLKDKQTNKQTVYVYKYSPVKAV